MRGYLILLLLPGLVGAPSLVTLSPGDSVTLICSEESNITGNLTLITWRKENGFRSLYFVSDFNRNSSNFTDPRISFLSAQRPLLLQIRDARPDDAGNYTCEITSTSGYIPKSSWTLQISGLVGAPSLVTLSPGDSVTLICSEESNITGDLTLITWRKENGFHSLHFVSDFNKTFSNFTDPRISFLSAQRPLLLQIRDARPDDAGNYTCEITVNPSGIRPKSSWTLQISEQPAGRYEIIRWILAVVFFAISVSAVTFAINYKPKGT